MSNFEEAYLYLKQYTVEELQRGDVTGADLVRLGLANHPRTGRRYKRRAINRMLGNGDHPPVRSSFMEDYYEEVEAEPEINLKEFFKWAREEVRKSFQEDPIVTHDTFTFEGDKPIAAIFPSCIHLGGRYTKYEAFEEVFNKVLTIPRLYWGSLGDDIEGFLAGFRDVKAVYDQLRPVPNQIVVLREILSKIAEHDKLLFGVSSQHGGKWLRQDTGKDPVKQLYLDLGVPYFDGMGYVKFKVGDQVYNVAFAHSFKGNSQWNPSHGQTRALRWNFPNADVVIMGDKHEPAVQQFPVYKHEFEAGNRKSAMALMLQSGTAKTGPDPYTIENWPTGTMGWPVVVFFPDRHEIKWSWDLADIIHWLDVDE